MARSSSRGSRQVTTWAVPQNPKPQPRMVRLGRPANDNARRPNLQARVLAIGLATALFAFFFLSI